MILIYLDLACQKIVPFSTNRYPVGNNLEPFAYTSQEVLVRTPTTSDTLRYIVLYSHLQKSCHVSKSLQEFHNILPKPTDFF